MSMGSTTSAGRGGGLSRQRQHDHDSKRRKFIANAPPCCVHRLSPTLLKGPLTSGGSPVTTTKPLSSPINCRHFAICWQKEYSPILCWGKRTTVATWFMTRLKFRKHHVVNTSLLSSSRVWPQRPICLSAVVSHKQCNTQVHGMACRRSECVCVRGVCCKKRLS